MNNRKGQSYWKRVVDIQAIYEHWRKSGLSNREIWRRHVYPRYYITERTFYSILHREVAKDAPPSAAVRPDEGGCPPWLISRNSKP